MTMFFQNGDYTITAKKSSKWLVKLAERHSLKIELSKGEEVVYRIIMSVLIVNVFLKGQGSI